MGGFSITLFRLDDELKKYYNMPCHCPYYTKGDVVDAAIDDECDMDNDETVSKKKETKIEYHIKDRKNVLEELDADNAKDMLLYIAQKIIDKKMYLTEIDSAIGDGDHGIGMYGGMKKVQEKLERMQGVDNVYAIFEAAGKAMLMSMGGASGVIFGSLYLAGAKDMDAQKVITAEDLFKMEKKSLEAIQERGKAQVGDKTMVDALYPAVDAMEKNYDKGLLEMLKAAEKAAADGVENTKKYQAKFGRAKSLMERAIGYQDAGATSVWLILQGMREFVEGN